MIYFDNGATTPLCSGAKEGIERAIERFGNPSSLHREGMRAQALLEETRADLLRALGTRGELFSVVFTSGGTEANDLAILGTARAKKRRDGKILLSDSEHPCIEESAKVLEKEGVKVVRLPTTGGRIDPERFAAEMTENVFLVSIMSVNNETGAVYDIAPLFAHARRVNPGVICHTDGVQAFLKIPFTVRSTGADLLSISSHKIHGPKGCGALVIRREILKRRAIVPLLPGGGQEEGLRSGTENVIGIAGFGGAIAEKAPTFVSDAAAMAALRAYLLERLPAEVRPNLPEKAAPHVLSLTLPGIKSETMRNDLSQNGICVSSGSACSSHGGKNSRVLLAFGLSEREADATIRLSFSADNTTGEIDRFLQVLTASLGRLVRF